jgi:tetratricopeptide (TPR) repeat protein
VETINKEIHFQNLNAEKVVLETVNQVDSFKELFYQCQFTKIVTTIDLAIGQEDKHSALQKLIQLKAKSLFELNRREEATEILKMAALQLNLKSSTDLYYAKGSFDYFSGNYQEAKENFKLMLEMNSSDENTFLSLLSLANVHYSEGNTEESLSYIKELEKLVIGQKKEYVFSLNLLKANILLGTGKSLNRASEIYEDIYREATLLNWSYFSSRALYYMVKVLVKKQEEQQALGILKVLDLFLKTMDWRFLSSLVNKEFNNINHVSSQKVILDHDLQKIIIGSVDVYEIELGKWPILFNLIALLYTENDFVSKEKIATGLWKGQKYLPKTHDARIYDLMARVKKKIEVNESVSLLIESRNGGYRLNY